MLLAAHGSTRLRLRPLGSPPFLGGILRGLCIDGSLARHCSRLRCLDRIEARGFDYLSRVARSLLCQTVERHASIESSACLSVGLPREGGIAQADNLLGLTPLGGCMHWRLKGQRAAAALRN